jgi:valyl-tRNA synthetase
MQTEAFAYDKAMIKSVRYNPIDRWIISKFNLFAEEIQKLFANYRFDLIAQNIYDFIWHEYCDWYLELSKVVLTSAAFDENEKYSTRYTLLNILEQTLRLIHPIIPFISEKIWQQIASKLNINAPSIMIQPYPQFAANQIDAAALQDIEWLKKIILGVRNIRGEMNISPNKLLPLLLHKGTARDREKITEYQEYLNILLKLESITWTEQPPPSATALVETLELNIPLAGLIDKDAEIERLNKEINKLQKDVMSTETKLNNPNYVAKAPQDVVEKERQKINDLRFALEKLQQKVKIMSSS